jgi:hypothetical protein
MIRSSSMDLLWTCTSLLLALLTLVIALRYLKHRDRGNLLIIVGGLLAGILGITSQIFRYVYYLFDPDWLRTAWSIAGIGVPFGQLIFLTGILLAVSRASNERQRIAELEAIIRDRDGNDSSP